MTSRSIFSKRYFGMLFLSLLLLVGCVRDKTPVGVTFKIDPEVVGDWYHVDVHPAKGVPPLWIHGIRILENGEVKSLAVEIATGKLALLDTISRWKFNYFINGSLDFEPYRFGFTFP